jgi:hypothetical protein
MNSDSNGHKKQAHNSDAKTLLQEDNFSNTTTLELVNLDEESSNVSESI